MEEADVHLGGCAGSALDDSRQADFSQSWPFPAMQEALPQGDRKYVPPVGNMELESKAHLELTPVLCCKYYARSKPNGTMRKLMGVSRLSRPDW